MQNKNILLVSLWGNYNYGNKLQSYALKTLLEQLGYSVTIAKHDKPSVPFKRKIKSILKRLFGKTEYKEPFSRLREIKFEDFSDSYVEKFICVNNFNSKTINPNEYYAAVVGSDQVWHNYSNTKREVDYFYLTFMPKKKRVAYAPSFGSKCFPVKFRNRHIQNIKELKVCSCREIDGCEEIAKYTGVDTTFVLDPTLCLPIDKWNTVAQKPEYINSNNFVVVYFIGGKSRETNDFIKRYSKSKGLEIIDIYDYSNSYFEKTGPSEFVWLIKNAKFVFTDSFHSTVFSILYGIPFLVFRRNNEKGEGSFSRISSLLSIVGLENRVYGKCEVDDNQDQNVGYSEKLLQLQEKSVQFLKDSLDNIC